MQRRGLIGFAVGAMIAIFLSGCSFTPEESSKSATPSGGPAIGQESSTPSPDASPAITASVTIAGVDVDGFNMTVGGFVAGVVESGGTCEYDVTSAATGAVQSKSNTGVDNVSTTSCGSLQFPIADFTRGSWEVVLKYTSGAIQVSSSPLAVIVP